ncbi:MAG TPA: hypothetical protein VFP09_06580 [Desertimonas sp.]|nr:hypothetical protein [Desertimonas sp.]
MPTNQSPILSHDPDVGPAQPAAHLDSVQFAGASFPTRGRRGSTGGDTGGHFAV